jgi:hypothetical protein
MTILDQADRFKRVFFDQIKNRHAPFLLDISAAPQNRVLVECDMSYAKISHQNAAFADMQGEWQAPFHEGD